MSRLDPLTDALRACCTARQLVEVTGCSERSAWRYLAGSSVPPLLTLTRLMGMHRRIADAVLTMAGLDDASLRAELAGLRTEWEALSADYERLVASRADAAAGETAAPADECSQAADRPARVTP